MKRSVLGLIVAVVAVAGIVSVTVMSRNDGRPGSINQTAEQAGRGTDHESNSAPNDQNEVSTVPEGQVIISDFAFNPKSVTVSKGTTVTWTNQDSAKHDITPDQESEDFVGSKLLAKGESYSFTFNKAGSYSYFCSPHPYMKATVEVAE